MGEWVAMLGITIYARIKEQLLKMVVNSCFCGMTDPQPATVDPFEQLAASNGAPTRPAAAADPFSAPETTADPFAGPQTRGV